jgi:hypothetical protein
VQINALLCTIVLAFMQARGGAVLARRICDADGLRSYVLPASTTSQPRERAQVLLAAGSPSRWRVVAELVDQAVRRDCAQRGHVKTKRSLPNHRLPAADEWGPLSKVNSEFRGQLRPSNAR